MHTIQYKVAEEWAEIGYGNVVSLQFRSDGRELAAVLDVGGDSRIALWDLQRNVERKPVNARGSDIDGAIPPRPLAGFRANRPPRSATGRAGRAPCHPVPPLARQTGGSLPGLVVAREHLRDVLLARRPPPGGNRLGQPRM